MFSQSCNILLEVFKPAKIYIQHSKRETVSAELKHAWMVVDIYTTLPI